MATSQLDRCGFRAGSHEAFLRACPAPRKLAVPDSIPAAAAGPPGATRDTPDGWSPAALDLRREEHRLLSLRDWPVKFLSKERAARNGLYYAGQGDSLHCHFCHVELQQWKEGDDAEADHGRWSPQCPFLLGKAVGNVPAEESRGSGRDVCGILAGAGAGRPVYPSRMTEPSRLETFERGGWPARMRQTPAQLADAGFFYTGQEDQTLCYYCGGGLKDWEEEDVPWEQHALWFPGCPYLLAIKGAAPLSPVPTPAPAPARHGNHLEVDRSREWEREGGSEPEASGEGERERGERERESSKLCKICFEEECNVCFVPCGHVVVCMKCAMSVSTCPMCRQPYTSVVKLFYS